MFSPRTCCAPVFLAALLVLPTAVLMIQTPSGTLRADFENAVMQAIVE